MILLRVPLCNGAYNGEKIVLDSGHTCSAGRARERVNRTLLGHDDFLCRRLLEECGRELLDGTHAEKRRLNRLGSVGM
jgi:hypothetical protein